MYINPEKPRTPGMARSSRNEVDVAASFEQFDKLVVSAGFGYLRLRQETRDRLTQRSTEQRMVVGNHKPVLQRFIQIRNFL
jgi:hypothetical protein